MKGDWRKADGRTGTQSRADRAKTTRPWETQNKLKFNPAVELSYLAPQEQEQFYEYIQSEECTPSLSQAQLLTTKPGEMEH